MSQPGAYFPLSLPSLQEAPGALELEVIYKEKDHGTKAKQEGPHTIMQHPPNQSMAGREPLEFWQEYQRKLIKAESFWGNTFLSNKLIFPNMRSLEASLKQKRDVLSGPAFPWAAHLPSLMHSLQLLMRALSPFTLVALWCFRVTWKGRWALHTSSCGGAARRKLSSLPTFKVTGLQPNWASWL